METLRIPRRLSPTPASSLELHGFSDASESAYSACIYMRSVGKNVTVRLIAAKTKVSTIKTVSLPRLELCGALLMARLLSTVKSALQLEISECHGWTDSTIVLCWLQAHPSSWKCFVANRVSAIQDILPPSQWHHIRSSENPADCASRGISASELLNHSLWWTGPQLLLSNPIQFPLNPTSNSEVPDTRSPTVHVTIVIQEPELLTRFSSLTKLQRVTAYLLRFVRNGRKLLPDRELGPLALNHLNEALKSWVKIVQALHFSNDIASIKTDKLSKKSNLRFLTPFLDNEGILRVGGRLKNSALPYSAKHPILLPKHSHLATLVIRHFHLTHLHSGTTLTLATIQRQFWIIGGKARVRGYIRKCIPCHRYSAEPISTLMSDLPSARVTPDSAFRHCGVDYAGPYMVKTKTGRGSSSYKAYVCLFVCMSTKSIHLELVSSLSTPAFIAAFTRFIASRGRPLKIFSDRGTNFVGADRELKRFLSSQEYKEPLSSSLANDGIQWQFKPPASPHHGGIWEAGVKSVKFHIKRAVGDACFTYEEFLTLLKQVEACVNSRPICPLSAFPDDLHPLTPGHFLIGRPLTSIPEPEVKSLPVNRLTRWELVQKTVQGFWKRWSMEYLSQLQQRPKWWKSTSNLQPNQLVLLKDRTAPLKWNLARIVETHPGKDDVVRVVTVRTGSSLLQRTNNQNFPLPLMDNDL